MRIGEATAAAVPALAALYAEAVRTAGPEPYDAAQVEAWAAFVEDARFGPLVLDPAEAIPYADLVEIPDAGRMLMIERPEAF